MTKIYSYVLRYDDGAAPNPFWDICTLTICKPAIRRKAQIGDWVIGSCSKNAKCNVDEKSYRHSHIVYAMRITDIKTLHDYDAFCKVSLPNKIPNWKASDWRLLMGDCIYDYSDGSEPSIRKSVHNEGNRITDLSGNNALLSDEFYYFGEKPVPIDQDLIVLIKSNQGHKKIENSELILKFEQWIARFTKNKIYGDPQMCSIFQAKVTDEVISKCAQQDYKDDEDETEETIC